jgi:hypothetical protein
VLEHSDDDEERAAAAVKELERIGEQVSVGAIRALVPSLPVSVCRSTLEGYTSSDSYVRGQIGARVLAAYGAMTGWPFSPGDPLFDRVRTRPVSPHT